MTPITDLGIELLAVSDQSPHDCQLLSVLLAKVSAIRADHVQQLEDHRGDTTKVAVSMRAA